MTKWTNGKWMTCHRGSYPSPFFDTEHRNAWDFPPPLHLSGTNHFAARIAARTSLPPKKLSTLPYGNNKSERNSINKQIMFFSCLRLHNCYAWHHVFISDVAWDNLWTLCQARFFLLPPSCPTKIRKRKSLSSPTNSQPLCFQRTCFFWTNHFC